MHLFQDEDYSDQPLTTTIEAATTLLKEINIPDLDKKTVMEHYRLHSNVKTLLDKIDNRQGVSKRDVEYFKSLYPDDSNVNIISTAKFTRNSSSVNLDFIRKRIVDKVESSRSIASKYNRVISNTEYLYVVMETYLNSLHADMHERTFSTHNIDGKLFHDGSDISKMLNLHMEMIGEYHVAEDAKPSNLLKKVSSIGNVAKLESERLVLRRIGDKDERSSKVDQGNLILFYDDRVANFITMSRLYQKNADKMLKMFD